MKKHKHQKVIATALATALVSSVLSVNPVEAAATFKLSTKSITLTVGQSTTLKANQKVTKWKTSNSSIVTIKKLTNRKSRITARKKGSCKISVSNGKKTLKVTVTVRAKKVATATPAATKTPVITNTPVATAVIETTNVPVITETPIVTEATNVPVITETPIVTESANVPVITETPIGTEITNAPVHTEIPIVTDVPTSTENPVETATDTPEATNIPDITETPVITTGGTITVSSAAMMDVSKVHISFTYKSMKDAVMIIENDNDVAIQYETTGYYLEKKNQDTWKPLPIIDIYREPRVMSVLAPNSTVSYSVKNLEDYGFFKDGDYRIVVPIYYTPEDATEPETYFVNSEFTIAGFSVEKTALTVSSVDINSSKNLSLIIKNDNDVAIQYDQADYCIEVQNGNTWEQLPSVDIIRPTTPVVVYANSEKTLTINYMEYYGRIPAGKYRIVLPISSITDNVVHTYIHATFTITE